MYNVIGAFVLCIWLFSSQCSAQTVFGNFSEDLRSWNDLATEAGYYTKSSGKWKGGLPRVARKTRHDAYSCIRTHRDEGFCLEWRGKQSIGDGGLMQQICNCTIHADRFCQEWQCQPFPRRRACKQASLPCIEDAYTRISNCACKKGAANENPYCQEWRCVVFDIRGVIEHSNNECTIEDFTGNYCHRWESNIQRNSHVQHAVCDCFERELDHCLTWLCEKRSIRTCTSYKFLSWCYFGVAVGVYGTIGLVIELCTLVVAVRAYNKDKKCTGLVVLIIGLGITFLFMTGVAISGGVEAIGWVSLMWGLPLLVFAFAMIYPSIKRKFKTLKSLPIDSPA